MSDDWNTFSSPVAPSPKPAPAAATGGDYDSISSPAARGDQNTYQAIERFVKAKFPNAVFTSDYRDPTHNKSVGGVEGSYHTTHQAVDMTGLSDTERSQLKSDLTDAGVYPREFLFHNAGSGLHLHIAADRLPDAFMQQWGNAPTPAPAPAAAPGTPVPPNTPAPDRAAEIAQAQAQATTLLQNGQEKEALDLLAHHNLQVSPGEMEAFHQGKRSVGFNHKDAPKPDDSPSLGDYAAGAAENLGRGAVNTLGFIDDAIAQPFKDLYNVVPRTKRLIRSITGETTPEDIQSWKDQAGPGFFEKGIDSAYTDVAGQRAPKNVLQRYVDAASQGVGGALIPIGGVSKGARAAAGLVLSGAGAGVGGQAGHDLFPNSTLAPLVGSLIGGAVGGTPLAVKPIAETRFVNQQVKSNPYAAYDAEIASELHGLTTNKAKSAVDPKGRAVVTATEINDLERSYTTGFQRKINALDIPDNAKRELTDALLEDHSISADKLDALRGTPEGDAVATGIIKAQRLRQLTPEVKRSGGMATVRRVSEILGTVGGALAGAHTGMPEISALTAPAGYGLVRLALRRGTEAEAARVHSAERVIDKAPLYSRVADQVGPSGQIAAKQGLNDLYDGQVEAAATAKGNAAQAKSEASAQAAQEAADAKAARSNMTPAQHAAYIVREQAAADALKADPVLPPSPRGIQASLKKVQKASTGSAQKLSEFDAALATPKPVAPVKLSPEDLAIKNNMDQGLKGYHRNYADAISSHLGVEVQPTDVLAALKKTDLSDVDPFQVQKFEMQHKVSPAAKAAILPRVEAVLRSDKSVMERPVPAAPAKAPAAATPKVAQAKPAAAPAATPEPAATAEPAPGDLNYKAIRRPAQHAQGTAKFQANFDRVINDHAMKHDGPMLSEATTGIDYIRNSTKTTDAAMEYFDSILGPKLRNKGFDAEEIDHLRATIKEASTVGKPYQTQAQLEHGAMTKGPGRPRKVETSTDDDVPF